MEMASWKELESKGIVRCTAIQENGKQCKRRAVTSANDKTAFCAKHLLMYERILESRIKLNKSQV
jgi:hypothetical protein